MFSFFPLESWPFVSSSQRGNIRFFFFARQNSTETLKKIKVFLDLQKNSSFFPQKLAIIAEKKMCINFLFSAKTRKEKTNRSENMKLPSVYYHFDSFLKQTPYKRFSLFLRRSYFSLSSTDKLRHSTKICLFSVSR